MLRATIFLIGLLAALIFSIIFDYNMSHAQATDADTKMRIFPLTEPDDTRFAAYYSHIDGSVQRPDICTVTYVVQFGVSTIRLNCFSLALQTRSQTPRRLHITRLTDMGTPFDMFLAVDQQGKIPVCMLVTTINRSIDAKEVDCRAFIDDTR